MSTEEAIARNKELWDKLKADVSSHIKKIEQREKNKALRHNKRIKKTLQKAFDF